MATRSAGGGTRNRASRSTTRVRAGSTTRKPSKAKGRRGTTRGAKR